MLEKQRQVQEEATRARNQFKRRVRYASYAVLLVTVLVALWWVR